MTDSSRAKRANDAEERSGLVPALSAREHLDAADRFFVRRQLHQALANYEHALDRGEEDVGIRVDALYGIASVYRVREVFGTAVGFYKRVLALEPGHNAALHSLIHLYASNDQWDDVETCELRLLKAITDSRALIDELVASGDRWWKGAGQPERARVRYEQASNLDEGHEVAKRRLVELEEDAPATKRRGDHMAMAPTPAVCSLEPIVLRLDERIVGQVDELAERQGKSRNAIMMLALLHYLEANRKPPVGYE